MSIHRSLILMIGISLIGLIGTPGEALGGDRYESLKFYNNTDNQIQIVYCNDDTGTQDPKKEPLRIDAGEEGDGNLDGDQWFKIEYVATTDHDHYLKTPKKPFMIRNHKTSTGEEQEHHWGARWWYGHYNTTLWYGAVPLPMGNPPGEIFRWQFQRCPDGWPGAVGYLQRQFYKRLYKTDDYHLEPPVISINVATGITFNKTGTEANTRPPHTIPLPGGKIILVPAFKPPDSGRYDSLKDHQFMARVLMDALNWLENDSIAPALGAEGARGDADNVDEGRL